MDILSELRWRGLIQDVSDEKLGGALRPGDAFYVGFDPTAASLHIGSLIQLIAAMHLGRAGLKPILLFGGATGSIGDPSGKKSERPLLSREQIDQNVASIVSQVKPIFERAGVTMEAVNNYDWTHTVSILDFLRDVGKHFPLNYMIAKETVKTRLEGDGISFTEFSYMLLQSFDFYHLYTARNCRLQIGGSDQWGNITAGLELIRRKCAGEAFALSIPLLLDSQGRKMGKTQEGALWISSDLVSPYKFHQYFLNVADADVVRLLKIFTFKSHSEIAELEKSLVTAPEKREPQRALADAACTLVHGADATRAALKSAEVLFGGSIVGLSDHELENIFADVPSTDVPRAQIGSATFAEFLASVGVVKSKGEARRLIENGGAYLNSERVTDPNLSLAGIAGGASGIMILRTGKKNYHLVRMMGS